MTFRVNFYADQALLSMVKKILKNGETYTEDYMIDHEPIEAATAIILCTTSCEAFLNLFAREIALPDFSAYERISVARKIEYLYSLKDLEPDWSSPLLKDIKSLVKVRNWLVHFKDSDLGLIGSEGWIDEENKTRPEIDDQLELKFERVRQYYGSCREVLLAIAKVYDMEDSYQYLSDEDYMAYLVG